MLTIIAFMHYMLLIVPNTNLSGEFFTEILFMLLFSVFVTIPPFVSLYLLDKKIFAYPVWKRKSILFLVSVVEVLLIIYLIFGTEFQKKDLFVDGFLIAKISALCMLVAILLIPVPKKHCI